MTIIIHKRHYLLGKKGERLLIHFSRYFIFEKCFTVNQFRYRKLEEISKKSLPMILRLASTNNLLLKCWQNATDDMKNAVALSYSYPQLGVRKVLNVEIQNWREIDYFTSAHKVLLKQRSNIFHPITAIQARLRTSGKHYLNLRFKNIHLSADFINGKLIYQLHWDSVSPTDLNQLIKHIFSDDILG
jgi:hypothetical protein